MLIMLLKALVLGMTAAVTPGPLQAFLLSESARHGWRRVLPLALIPVVSDGPIIIITLLLLSQAPEGLLIALRLGGGVFMLYLAWKSYQSLQDQQEAQEVEQVTKVNFRSGVLLNLLNPNPWIFWTVIGSPLIIEAWQMVWWGPWAFMGVLYGVFTPLLALLIVLMSLAAGLGTRISHVLQYVASFALALLGLVQLWQGIKQLLG